MKIVVLDGYALNPGDLNWSGMEALGDLTVYDRTPKELVRERSAGADVLLTNKTPLDEESINALPELRYIGVLATGYNVVDVEAAKKRGIPVTNIPDYSTDSVAQAVFAHLLNLTQRVAEHAQSVRNGDWNRSADFCYWNFPLLELKGLTMGLIGFGRIGRATGELARAFGMKVIASKSNRSNETPDWVERVEMDELFRRSDVVSLHCPQTDETLHLVNRERLALMKPTAFLINTSRGGLVDEAALYDALKNNTISGAGLDVVTTEPPRDSNPLFELPNCYITPHIAWATKSARSRLLNVAVENLESFSRGDLQNLVNGPLGD